MKTRSMHISDLYRLNVHLRCSFQPSPFFVLDEIDAALDASNVARVASYIREKTRDGAPDGFQSIVISLKDIFFERADALVRILCASEVSLAELSCGKQGFKVPACSVESSLV